MEKAKVKSLILFNDLKEKVQRTPGDVFVVDLDRFEFLKSKKAISLVEFFTEKDLEITEEKKPKRKTSKKSK